LNDNTLYWVQEAKEDLITAGALLKTKRYLECCFFCHLSVEKLLKAIIEKKTQGVPPKSHNLIFLARKSGILNQMDEPIKQLIADLQPFNIEGRYPEDRRKLLSSTPVNTFHDIYNRTQEGIEWLEKKFI